MRKGISIRETLTINIRGDFHLDTEFTIQKKGRSFALISPGTHPDIYGRKSQETNGIVEILTDAAETAGNHLLKGDLWIESVADQPGGIRGQPQELAEECSTCIVATKKGSSNGRVEECKASFRLAPLSPQTSRPLPIGPFQKSPLCRRPNPRPPLFLFCSPVSVDCRLSLGAVCTSCRPTEFWPSQTKVRQSSFVRKLCLGASALLMLCPPPCR